MVVEEKMVRVEGLVKRYGEKVALKGFNLKVGEREAVAIIGPNGAGKTTFFRILTKLLKPDEGKILYLGKERGREVLPWIRYLPEVPAFPQELRVKDLLAIHCGFYSKSGLDELVERFGISPFYKKSLGSLSKGLKKRAFLVASLLGYSEAKLIVLDEPFDGLDPEAAVVLREFIREQKEKRAILVSSHALYHLPKVTDRIVFIKEGRAVREILPEGKTGEEIEEIYLEIVRGKA